MSLWLFGLTFTVSIIFPAKARIQESMHMCTIRTTMGRVLTPSIARIVSVSLFLTNSILLLTYHVRAESTVDSDDVSSLFSRLRRNGPSGLHTTDKILLGALVTMGFELLDFCAKHWGEWFHSKRIPVRGKHLDILSAKDILFIGFSKANTAPFTYFYFRYAFAAPKVIWSFADLNWINTAVALSVLFLVFDFWYTLLHWFLHIKGVYGYIHKHHHQQKAPSRAAVDAVNVHPIEYLLGEYNHLWTLYLVTTLLACPVHAVTTLAFLVLGGMMAALNHTRYDLVIPLLGSSIKIYDTKVHDVHHRIPQSNYGQYTMFWDAVFGSYRYVLLCCVVCISFWTQCVYC